MNAKLPTCPECGWNTAQAAEVLPLRFRQWRFRLILILTILPLLVLLGWALVVSKSKVYSLGSPLPKFLEPAVSPEDLQRIADGQAVEGYAPGDLSRRLMAATVPMNSQIPGRRSIEAGFAAPATSRSRSWKLGWPFPWVVIERDLNFDDAVRKTRFIRAKTNAGAPPLGMYEAPSDGLNVPPGPRWRWQGMGLRFQRQPEDTGGVFTVSHIQAPAILLSVLLTIGLGWILTALIRFAYRRRSREAPRRLAAAMLGVSVLIIGLLSLVASGTRDYAPLVFARMKQANFPPAPVYFTRDGFSRLGIDAGDLSALSRQSEGDRTLASELLQRAPRGKGERLYLAATYDHEASIDPKSRMLTLAYEFPVASLGREQYLRRPDFGAVKPLAPRGGLRFSTDFGRVRINWSGAVPGAATWYASVSFEMLALLLSGPLVIAFAIRMACRRIVVRRCRRGQCPQCRYDVRTP